MALALSPASSHVAGQGTEPSTGLGSTEPGDQLLRDFRVVPFMNWLPLGLACGHEDWD